MDFRIVQGEARKEYIEILMEWRLKYFRQFPYLYEGSREYEESYLEGFLSHSNGILALASHGDSVVGIVTALPLLSEFGIATETDALAQVAKVSASAIFYIGEVIVDRGYRGRGLSRRLLELAEEYARSKGFTTCSLLTVVREDEHPLRPKDYISTDAVWRNLGYQRAGVATTFEWPTIHPGGEVSSVSNPMEYWIKRI